ncbi:hypothetical protein R9C00_24045 [Flammeovirgaceae bacterium SG7u.111]|nr:hypothetical protein [Flammeovirgaceae bacterium SG7u.132]WPO34775.1 hypothetical protein R9C00_24045 [Flammeovirgaceae bacterium SG7u.111]
MVLVKNITLWLAIALLGAIAISCSSKTEESQTEIPIALAEEVTKPDSVDEQGLIVDDGYLLVRTNCISCHSLNLVTQNRATRDGWKSMIRWMQKEQKLWDLGPNEDKILDYLAKNYAPEQTGRRVPLENVEWYELEE